MADKDSQKKQIGELLKAADRHIKAAEWSKALEEVNKALSAEPNNMYAMAYKDRINASISEEKKKAEEEKVKKLAEEKKSGEKSKPEKMKGEITEQKPPVEEIKEFQKPDEPPKPVEEPKSTDQSKLVEESKAEPVLAEVKQKEETPVKVKDDSAARVELLRQEFAATQAKLQRDVAQLTMQVKEKEAIEKNLLTQIAALQTDLLTAKQQSGKAAEKEIDTLKKEIEGLKKESESSKTRQQKELDRAKELAQAEVQAQLAILQKENETLKKTAQNATPQKFAEETLKLLFVKAWADGTINNDERKLLEVVKEAAGVPDEVFSEIESSSKSETYMNALRMVWQDGTVSTEESDFLAMLREKLDIPADAHFKLENQVRKELRK